MNQLFDTLGQFEKPDIILCNPNRDELYSLNTARNLKHTMRFNAVSEFTFTIEQYVDDTLIPAYDNISAKKIVYLKDIGYFVVSEVSENTDGKIPSKDVICYSQEIELSFKKIAINGTKKFYNLIPVPGQTTLMDIILSYLPSWSLGTIDSDLWNLYRTFDVSDNNLYNFMMTDVETAYGCIFTFDTINKTISATAIENVTIPTDIYLSYDNLLQNAYLKEIAQELCTKLYVYGSNGLGISSVNPLGGNAIYDFSYYKNLDWMTQGLIDAIDAWEVAIAANQATYSTYLLDLISLNTTLITKNGELTVLLSQLSAQEILQQAAIEAGTSLTTIYAAIAVINGNIIAKEAEIAVVEGDIVTKTAQITAIVDLLSFDVNFTTPQKQELDSFIFENTYQNSTLTLTDTMTPNERQDVAQQLYNEATLLVMPKVSIPRYEFSADTTNFPLLQEFSQFTNQLEMGCTVTINVRDTYTITPALLEIVIGYDNPSDFSMTFSNRLRLDNAGFIFTDLVGNNNNVSTTVGFNSTQWGNWEANYKDTVTTFVTSALDASVNMLMSSDDEEITISNVGLRGQRLVSPGVYSDKKVWLTSNLLAFTDDNWATAALALGEISLPGGGTAYGLAANVIVGTLLAGTQLLITNSGGTFSVDANGATLIDASFTLDNSVSKITLDPTYGILVQKKNYVTDLVEVGTTSTAVGSSVSSLSWSHTIPSNSNRLLIVTISSAKSGTPLTTSVSFAGTPLTRLGGLQASNNMSEIWYLKNPIVGTGTISIVCASGTYIEAGATNYYNVDQTTTFRTIATASGTSTTPSISLTSSASDYAIDSLSYNNGGSSFTRSPGQTLIYSVTSDGAWKGASSYKEAAPTSTTMSWTGTSTFWILVGVCLITATGSYSLVDSFYLDVSGNAHFSGDISGATGTFSGTISATSGNIGAWTINGLGIQSSDLTSKLWSYGSGIYDINIGSFVVVDDSFTRYVDYQGDTFNVDVSNYINLSSINTLNIGTAQLNLNITDSTTGLQVRGSPTWNSDITITAGYTLVIRNGLIFDYFI